MKGYEYKFRNLLKKICYIEGKPNSVIREEFESDEKVNGFIGYGYIDHDAGFTFEVLACASKEEDTIKIYKENDNVTFKSRIRHVMEKEVEVLEDDSFDIKPFLNKIANLEKLYNGDVEIEALRDITEIDHLRSNEFPDDVLVLMYKEDVKPEKCWVRLEGLTENYMQGRLLHELTSSAYGLKTGDVVDLYLMQDENKKITLLCLVGDEVCVE